MIKLTGYEIKERMILYIHEFEHTGDLFLPLTTFVFIFPLSWTIHFIIDSTNMTNQLNIANPFTNMKNSVHLLVRFKKLVNNLDNFS